MTLTPTATVTNTPFVLPTAVLLGANAMPTMTAGVAGTCPILAGWTTYTVRLGDTLSAIARAVGSSVGSLRLFNCLDIEQGIGVGQVLNIPNPPITIVATSIPIVPLANQRYIPQGCRDSGTVITSPFSGESVTGVITLLGTASIANFASYQIDVRPASSDAYDFYVSAGQRVNEGELAHVNTNDYGDGLHTIRLTVLGTVGSVPQTCVIPVIFR